MIDDDVVRIARNRARIEVRRQDQELKDAIGRVNAQAATRGLRGSSIPLLEIAGICAAAAVERGERVWLVLHRVAVTAYVTWEPGLEAELKAIADEFLSPGSQDLRYFVREAAQVANIPGIIPQLEQIVAEGQREGRERAWNEIELFAASLRSAHSAHSEMHQGPVFHVNGPVGAIQTGNHATAYVAQGFDPVLRRQLIRLLDTLEERLPLAEGLTLQDRAQAIEVVREARAEAESPAPNRARLSALLLAAATALRMITSLKPVLDALKDLVESLGLRLPW